MNEILVFTDGSTLNNQEKGNRRGGIGVFFGDDDPRNLSISLEETDDNKVTNQVAELLACVKAIEKINDKGKKIIIYTDSMYIVNMMKTWASNWEKNDWKKSDGKPVLNIDLVKTLYNYNKSYNVEFRHVRSHTKEPSKDDPNYKLWYGNMNADRLAVEAANLI